jgi:hypothetical protein
MSEQLSTVQHRPLFTNLVEVEFSELPETSPITSQRPPGAKPGRMCPWAFRAEILKSPELAANPNPWHPSDPTHRSLEGEAWEGGRGGGGPGDGRDASASAGLPEAGRRPRVRRRGGENDGWRVAFRLDEDGDPRFAEMVYALAERVD